MMGEFDRALAKVLVHEGGYGPLSTTSGRLAAG